MKRFIFLLGCFFLGIVDCLALVVDCPEVISPTEEFVIRVSDNIYNGISMNYKFPEGFVIKNTYLENGFRSYYDGSNGGVIGNGSNNLNLGFNIRVIASDDILVNQSYILEFIDIYASDRDYKLVNLDNVSCNISVKSDINGLSNIIVSDVLLKPKFDSKVLNYYGTTKKDKINISASGVSNDVLVSGDTGEFNLALGVNTFVVRTTSARGNTLEYKLYITRESKNSDITLKTLSLSSGKLDFKSNVFYYEVDVLNSVDNIDVEAISSSDKARIEIIKPDKLLVGRNEINVIVTAEDGSSATYVIVVNRGELLSNDTSIKSLIVKNYDLDFKSDILEYSLSIGDEKSLDIEVILNDSSSKYKIIDNDNLENNSVIRIEVLAQDGSIRVYKIKISKDVFNSSSIGNYINIFSISCFIILIILVLVIKFLLKRFIKSDK